MNAAIDRHIDHVRELTRRGGPLDPRGPTASINNPRWFTPDGTATPERRQLHAAIRADLFAAASDGTDSPPHAMILAGPPGAGKSTLRRERLSEEVAGHVLIDPDEIKTLMLTQAREDGSLEDFLTPPAVRNLEVGGERFLPLEFSALVHMEAVDIAEGLRERALDAEVSMVIDGVLSQSQQAVTLGHQLESAGHRIDVVVADAPFEVSEHHIRHRWREAYERTLAGEGDLMGGRWVPSDYARAMFGGPDGRSRSVVAAEQLAYEVAAVYRYRLYRTDSVGAPSRLATELYRIRPGEPMVDREEAAQARRATFGRPARSRRERSRKLGNER